MIYGFISPPVHPNILDRAPDSFEKHVFPPGSTPFCRPLHSGSQHHTHKLLRRELTALIGIDDLRIAVSTKSLLQQLVGLDVLQRSDRPAGQEAATVNINTRSEIQDVTLHANVGRIHDSDQLAALDGQLPDLVDIDLVLRVSFARPSLGYQ